ncbi:MAG: PDZ domain-containing protein [Proteobacteria bacterium]|nr:PDZ domain-containing protein [Pseudomonadota bacterium]
MRRSILLGCAVLGVLALATVLRADAPAPDPVEAARRANIAPPPMPRIQPIAFVRGHAVRALARVDRSLTPATATPIAAEEPPPWQSMGALCRLARGTSTVRGRANVDHSFGMLIQSPAWASGQELRLAMHAPADDVSVQLDGFAPTQVDIVMGPDGLTCSPQPVRLERSNAYVSGLVDNAFGAEHASVWVEGCGARTDTEADGTYELSVAPGPCELRAFRSDGFFIARGPTVLIRPRAHDDIDVDLELPPHRTAGLGIHIREVEGGIVASRVREGGGAFAAGLRSGDLVVEIEGEIAVDLSLGDFADIAIGEPGTDVRIVVLRDGEDVPITVRRLHLNR